MAIDINEQVANAYNAAKQALNDDLKQNLYNATQARVQAFRQINNQANAQHSLYSGAPTGAQMQYDQSTYIPNIGKMAVSALSKQEENQEKWDQYMAYIKQLQDEANYYNSKANDINNRIPYSTAGGLTTNPRAEGGFASGQGGNKSTSTEDVVKNVYNAVSAFTGGGSIK